MPPLFNDTQQLDKSEIVDSLANKAPRTHKSTMISQGFNPETGDLATFVEHCKRADTTEKFALYKFPESYLDSNIIKAKKRSRKSEEREDSSNKRHKDSSRKESSLYCSLHG